MDTDKLKKFIENEWLTKAFPSLCDFIRIDNVSPDYDSTWYQNGKLIKAVNFIKDFADNYGIKGFKSEIIGNDEKPKKNNDDPVEYRPPFLFIIIDPFLVNTDKTILLYGHADKQPPFDGWDSDKFPYKPVVIGDRLYGRGSSDDGYSIFAALLSIKAIQDQNQPHPRIIITIEGEEESGSPNLPDFLAGLSTSVKYF